MSKEKMRMFEPGERVWVEHENQNATVVEDYGFGKDYDLGVLVQLDKPELPGFESVAAAHLQLKPAREIEQECGS